MSEQKHIRDVNCAINFKHLFIYYYFNIPSSPPKLHQRKGIEA